MYNYEDIQKIESLMAKADMLETEHWRSLVNNLITSWLQMYFKIQSMDAELAIYRVQETENTEEKQVVDYSEDFNYFGC